MIPPWYSWRLSHRGCPPAFFEQKSQPGAHFLEENEAGTAAPWDYPMVFLVLTQEKDNYIKSYKCVKIGFQENFINRLISIDRFLCCFLF